MAHINLIPGAITASSGAVGAVFIGSTATSATAVLATALSYRSSTNSLEFIRFGTKLYGTALTTNHITLSTGWGSTAVVSAISGTDQAYRFTVTAGAAPLSSGPSITTTYADGTFPLTTVTLANMLTATPGLANQPFLSWTVNASGNVIAPQFTPTTGGTYVFGVVAI